MISDLVAGVLAGLAVAMPIGAIGTYLVGLAARERFAVAAGAALGVASVDGGYAVVASVGGAGLQTVVQRIAGVLTVRRRSCWSWWRLGHCSSLSAATAGPFPAGSQGRVD